MPGRIQNPGQSHSVAHREECPECAMPTLFRLGLDSPSEGNCLPPTNCLVLEHISGEIRYWQLRAEDTPSRFRLILSEDQQPPLSWLSVDRAIPVVTSIRKAEGTGRAGRIARTRRERHERSCVTPSRTPSFRSKVTIVVAHCINALRVGSTDASAKGSMSHASRRAGVASFFFVTFPISSADRRTSYRKHRLRL